MPICLSHSWVVYNYTVHILLLLIAVWLTLCCLTKHTWNATPNIISMELGGPITVCLLRYHHYILVWFGMLYLGWLQFKLQYIHLQYIQFFLFPSIRKKTSITVTLSLYRAFHSFYNCVSPFRLDAVTLWTSSTVNMVACFFFYQRQEPELFYSLTTLPPPNNFITMLLSKWSMCILGLRDQWSQTSNPILHFTPMSINEMFFSFVICGQSHV